MKPEGKRNDQNHFSSKSSPTSNHNHIISEFYLLIKFLNKEIVERFLKMKIK